MAKPAPGRQVSGVQKLVLYLILCNVVMVLCYALLAKRLGAMAAIMVPLLLVGYNLLLCRLALKRARRDRDSYILYPVVVTAIILGFCVLSAMLS
ncbi:hypothetical protein [Gallaecimonas xiamenensis]|uniref:Transmembrane protein n=1 Tax=Gallaecimonas xiamenensis 3-C-1 TaxID=745411 RepID=K2JUD1_9GAMM|nr:hypothetical protein [Gallaecimonas xiamenensis]EKE73994.1 hypothetical protein B3C1_09253 [Gallaecimonas xiamenensis 3-C-1]